MLNSERNYQILFTFTFNFTFRHYKIVNSIQFNYYNL